MTEYGVSSKAIAFGNNVDCCIDNRLSSGMSALTQAPPQQASAFPNCLLGTDLWLTPDLRRLQSFPFTMKLGLH